MGRTKGESLPFRFEPGAQVRVGQGVRAPDFADIPLGGWAGTVREAERARGEIRSLIAWDRATLKAMHPIHQKRCERDGLQQESMWLGGDDLQLDGGTTLPIEPPTAIVPRPLSAKDQDDRARMALGLTLDDLTPRRQSAGFARLPALLEGQAHVPVPGEVPGRIVADRPPAPRPAGNTTSTKWKGSSARPGAVRGRSTFRWRNWRTPLATASGSGIMVPGSGTIAEAGRATMAKKKSKPRSPLMARWQITSMSEWDEEYLNEEVQAFVEFGPGQQGEFHFGYVHGVIDYRDVVRDGKPAIEFSWDGHDEMDPAQGRGWATLEGDRLTGMIFFHQGDASEFEADREAEGA